MFIVEDMVKDISDLAIFYKKENAIKAL